MVHSCVTLGIVLLAFSSVGSIHAHEEFRGHHIDEQKNKLMDIQHAVEITVMNREGVHLKDARVMVQPAGSAAPVPAGYDAARQIYYADVAHVPHVVIEVSHAEYEGEKRIVRIQSGHQESIFMLGKKGDTFAYVGQGKMPYTPRPEVVGFVPAMKSGEMPVQPDEFKRSIAAEIGVPADSIEMLSSGGWKPVIDQGVVHIVRDGSGKADMNMRREILEKLRRSTLVQQAGPVYRVEGSMGRGGVLQIFTNILLVQFMPGTGEQEIMALLSRLGARILTYHGSIDAYEIIMPESSDEDVNIVAERLLGSGLVYSATVNLGGVAIFDGN